MNNRKLIFAALAAALFPAAAAAQPIATSAATLVPQVLASGLGELKLPPDQATILFGVETSGVDAARAGRENAARIADLRLALGKLGVPANTMQTVGYSVRNEPRTATTQKIPNWFVARNAIRLVVNDVTRVGALIDGALSSGANQVDDLTFQIADELPVRRKALALAVQQARAQAEAMAVAAGGKLGDPLEIGTVDTPRPYQARAVMAMAQPSGETNVSRSEITISERVVGRWRLIMPAP